MLSPAAWYRTLHWEDVLVGALVADYAPPQPSAGAGSFVKDTTVPMYAASHERMSLLLLASCDEAYAIMSGASFATGANKSIT